MSTNQPVQQDYRNLALPLEQRVKSLVSQMTDEEKREQLTFDAPGIERLGLAPHNWWNECLHGVARAGLATVFPQAIGLAATFDVELMHRVAVAISDEARAKHHAHARRGDFGIYKGLSYWTPNINILRDPRWGRCHETYGECPYLTARLGVAFCKGLQGDDPKYLKLIATPKHYAVHSGPELGRHGFDARVSLKDLYETYLPAFRACVTEAKAYSVMGAYNRMNGDPCCAHHYLLQEVLRDKWGFEGFVVSDCGAIADIHKHHGFAKTPEESAAKAVINGLDLCCGSDYRYLTAAVEQGLLSNADIDRAVSRLMAARIRLGMFDPPEKVAYAQIPYEVVDSPEHRALSLESARDSIVLLKNDQGILPLPKAIKTIAVIGPNAEHPQGFIGNYFGTPPYIVSALEGIRKKVGDKTRVLYAQGSEHIGRSNSWTGTEERGFVEAIMAAEKAEVVILCLGLNPTIEGEEGDGFNSDAGGDRRRIELPIVQQKLLEKIVAVGKPVVLVNVSGGAVSFPWGHQHAAAVVHVFYPGQDGGTALADILFGDHNPSARLPMTVYHATEDLPPFESYAMLGRTYRFSDKPPLYPFGFGLSYTRFEYRNLKLPAGTDGKSPLALSVDVRNIGKRSGGEVVQVYLQRTPAGQSPLRQLVGFKKITLAAGESKTASFAIQRDQLGVVDESGNLVIQPATLRLTVGGALPVERSAELGAAAVVSGTVALG